MTLHKNRIEAMLYMIEQSGVNPSDIERTTGINRGQVYRWQARSVSNIRLESISLVAGALGYTFKEVGKQIEITKDNTTPQTGGERTEMDYTIIAQAKTIELLDEKTAALSSELAKYKADWKMTANQLECAECLKRIKILGQA
jgi:DNA-binding phage protein